MRGLHKAHLELAVPPLLLPFPTLTADHEGICGRGHHFVKLGVRVPKELSERRLDLWRRFARIESTETAVEGVVEGLEDESQDSHRYYVNVVEPSRVERLFKVEESELCEPDPPPWSWRDKFKRFVNIGGAGN